MHWAFNVYLNRLIKRLNYWLINHQWDKFMHMFHSLRAHFINNTQNSILFFWPNLVLFGRKIDSSSFFKNTRWWKKKTFIWFQFICVCKQRWILMGFNLFQAETHTAKQKIISDSIWSPKYLLKLPSLSGKEIDFLHLGLNQFAPLYVFIPFIALCNNSLKLKWFHGI